MAASIPTSNASKSPSGGLSIFSLTNRVALVTGAHRGIGLDMAVAMAEAGAIVYCLDLAAQPSKEWLGAQERVASDQGRLEYVSQDVTDQDGMRKAAEDIASKEGKLDICVACAGIGGDLTSCLDIELDMFRKVIDVDLTGVFITAQAAARQMVRLGTAGSIILLASIFGSSASKNPPVVAYAAAKGGVKQIAKAMACELGEKGIRVNSLSPGYVMTEMTAGLISTAPGSKGHYNENPLGRWATPDELRGAVLWLAGDASKFCTGSDVVVDGGHLAQ